MEVIIPCLHDVSNSKEDDGLCEIGGGIILKLSRRLCCCVIDLLEANILNREYL
jgi:hypothetical protein